MKHAAESVTSSDVKTGDLVRSCQRHGQWLERAGVGDALVWPVPVAGLLAPQGVQEVGRFQISVRSSSRAAGLHPPLHDRVHPRHSDPAQHGFDARVSEDGVE